MEKVQQTIRYFYILVKLFVSIYQLIFTVATKKMLHFAIAAYWITTTLDKFLLPLLLHSEYVQFTLTFSVTETPLWPTAVHVNVVCALEQPAFRLTTV